MSRRAKLILLALLLILLGIPVVYVVLSWCPENPLRVRVLTAAEMQQSSAPDPLFGKTPLMVENTSSVPIHVYGIWEGDRIQTGGWTSYAPLAPSATKPTPELLRQMRMMPTVVIPPHGSLQVGAVHTSASLQHPSEKVFYISASGVKHTVLDALEGCRSRLPASLHFLIPELQPDWHIIPVDSPEQRASAAAPPH